MARGAHSRRRSGTSIALRRAEARIGARRKLRAAAWPGWPANDNRPPAWRGFVGWLVLGAGLGCFAFVAITLLL